ncbi:UV DNA damage repair endonuclease UvsE [Clostridium sp. LP20]|uniref:UV DNA damage repair endonuclease UvsE n=1 Tax=Clostridium sp. LP20 TaxID=3418665 RepID=UPI003EE6E739
MIIRFGYVAISNKLGKKVTSSSTITYTNYSKINTEAKKLEKLKTVTASNIKALEDLIKYNIENNIHFYRITSALIPLATHPEVEYFGHREIFKKDFEYIGKMIKESNMRVDTHPDQFNVINSINPRVFENTIINLKHQEELFHDIGYEIGKMVIHIGGATGGKEAGIQRFIDNFHKLPEEIQLRLILENDDKTYTAKETLGLCKILDVPMVLDVHHHNCNNDSEKIEDFLEEVFNTWNKEELPPKIHFSSPREGEKDRKHADFINVNEFMDFLEKAKEVNIDFDVMLESKEKDLSLFKLVSDIREYNKELKWIDETTLLY